MVRYKNVIEKLNNKGYSTYRLRKEQLLSESTIQYIREGKPIALASVDTICTILDCAMEDVVEIVK